MVIRLDIFIDFLVCWRYIYLFLTFRANFARFKNTFPDSAGQIDASPFFDAIRPDGGQQQDSCVSIPPIPGQDGDPV